MASVIFSLSITYDQYLLFYKGSANAVIVSADDGRKIQFPASKLQRFLKHDGVHGRFKIDFDQNHKFVSMQQIA